jgi:predicted outer membrane protein
MSRIKEFAAVALMAASSAFAQDAGSAAQDAATGTGRPQSSEGLTNQGATGSTAQDRAGSSSQGRTGTATQGQDATRGARGQQGQDAIGMARFDDRLFVQAATEAGQHELLVSQLAVERASSDRVKQFARQMIEDHTQANQQLMQHARGITGGAGGQGLGNSGAGASGAQGVEIGGQASGSTRDPQVGRTSGQDVQGQAGAQGGQGQELTSTAIARMGPGKQAEYAILASLEGAEFDQAYLQQQTAAHICAIALYKAEAQMGRDENLKSFAAQTLPKLTQHLEMATASMDEVRGQAGGATGAGRSGDARSTGSGSGRTGTTTPGSGLNNDRGTTGSDRGTSGTSGSDRDTTGPGRTGSGNGTSGSGAGGATGAGTSGSGSDSGSGR